ncbi:MAG: phosphonate metabolism protein/1,5-bisphosphokinase (PRPP-forming) PhnN [Pseudomonadota bacterium]
MSGRVIAVVGPSGVGKDTVMQGLHAALPKSHLVRRVITRTAGAVGEDFDAVTQREFDALVQNDAFSVHWRAHGLSYGIPKTIKAELDQGKDCLVNFSRGALTEAAREFPDLVVLNVTAAPETIATRLTARDRETADEIAQRIAVSQKDLPPGLDVRYLSNDGPISETIARAIALLCLQAAPDPAGPDQTDHGRPRTVNAR